MTFTKDIHPSWNFNFTNKQLEAIQKIYDNGDVEPKIEYLFDSFKMSIDEIKCIIIGMDPYPNGEGIGYAFAYDNSKYKKPKSFSIIEKEIGHPLSPDLREWKQLGVMSVNSSLTVKKGFPGSHFNIWKDFTKMWIEKLDSTKSNLEFLFLGAKAREFTKYVKNNRILTAPHPATRHHDFIGSKIFKQSIINF